MQMRIDDKMFCHNRNIDQMLTLFFVFRIKVHLEKDAQGRINCEINKHTTQN